MSFLAKLDQFIITPHVVLPYTKPRNSHWPTEASFKGENGVIGKCLRQSWYNFKGVKALNPVDKKGQSIFDMGNAIEEWYTERAKRMGIWAADNVRYFDELRNISSEIDLVIFEDDQLVAVECKSAYGHYADKEVSVGPKIDHLMQTSLNLEFLNRTLKDNPMWSKRYYMEYFMRDSCIRYEHVIELVEQEGKTYPVVNGIEVRTFNLEGVFERYDELSVRKNFDDPPVRDFIYGYTKEEVEEQYKAGKISKSKYTAWLKGKKSISDWQCLYCPHLDTCWSEKRRGIVKDTVDELLEEAAA